MAEFSLKTMEIVEGVRIRARSLSQDWHSEIEKRRDWYNLKHYKSKAKPYEDRYTDPTPMVAADTAVSVLMAGDLEFSAQGFAATALNEGETARIEKFLVGLLQISSEREESELLYDLNLHFCRDGAAILYTVWDKVLAEDAAVTVQMINMEDPEQEPTPMPAFTEPPVRVQVIDPIKVSLIPGGPHRWSAVVREEEMCVADVENMYDVRMEKYGDRSIREKYELTDTLIDMWRIIREDDAYVVQNATVFAGQVLKPIETMEGYDDLPFTIAFFKPVDKSQSQGWGQGIIDPMTHTIEHLEKAINRRGRQITVYSSLPPTARLSTDRHLSIPNIMGQPIRLGPGEEFAFPQWPGNAPDVDKQIAFFADRLRMTGFVEGFYGMGQEGMSGYALSRLTDANKLKIEVPIKNLELMFSLWARKVMRLLVNKASGTVVRVYGQLRGDDFVEQVIGDEMSSYLVRASYRAKFPGDETRQHAMATQVRGIVSDETLMENYLGIEQPSDERRRRLREIAQTHPAMQQYLIMTALLEMARDGDMAAAMALQAIGQAQAQAQAQPRPLQAEGGMMGADNMPTRQEQGQVPYQEEAQEMGRGGSEIAGPMGGRPPGEEEIM